jgi:hypothetical protein
MSLVSLLLAARRVVASYKTKASMSLASLPLVAKLLDEGRYRLAALYKTTSPLDNQDFFPSVKPLHFY